MRKLFLLFWALLTTTCLWAYDFEVNGIYYNNLDGKNVEVTYRGDDYNSYNEYYGAVTIPASVTYNGTTYRVTSIRDEAFSNCSSLTSITIPNRVTSIGNYAFYGCYGLTSITIPNSVTSIGIRVFTYCSSLTSPVYNAHCFAYMPPSFEGAYTIPDGIKQIAGGAFSSCSSLTSITIPESVTSIGEYAFEGCSSLPVENNLRYADTYLVEAVDDTLSTYSIKDATKWIGSNAFYWCSSLTSITIPNCVTSIGNYAFYNCSSLTSITIPESVTSIGNYAFSGCSSLTSITWEAENVFEYSEVSDVPFYDIRSQITEFVFGNKVQCIPAYFCYEMEKLTSVTIGNSVMRIGKKAFWGCSALREITLPASLKNIESYAFAGTPRLYEVTCLAPEPPIAEESSFTNYDAYFHAYCDAQRYYSVDPVWKNFHNVECIVNENTITNNVTISPSDCEATVVWLSNDAAAAYSLIITKNGVTFCTLRFNKYGQLTNIAFAPSRTHDKQQAAEATSTGYSFTITGLDAGTKYDYQFSVLNDTNESIDEYFGEFTTKSNVTTDMDNIQSPASTCQKIFRNGQLIIVRDGVEYNAMGQEM